MPPQHYPVKAIASLLDLTERRVQQLVKDGTLPKPINGAYDPIGCVLAYIHYLRRLIAGSGELSLTEERTRLTKLQGDLVELQIRKARGKVIDSEKAMQAWGDITTSIRQQLLGLSTRLAPALTNCQSVPETKEQIDTVIRELLNELSSPDLTLIARTESGTESLEGLRAPAPVHSKRVGRRKKKTKPGVKRRARKVAHRKSRIPEGDDGRPERPESGTGDTHNVEPGGKDGDRQ